MFAGPSLLLFYSRAIAFYFCREYVERRLKKSEAIAVAPCPSLLFSSGVTDSDY